MSNYNSLSYDNIEISEHAAKGQRTDPTLYPDIEKDMLIIKKLTSKTYSRFKSYTMNEEDLFQVICGLYLEGKEKFWVKTRAIPHRVFVFSYIRFVLKRMYRNQYAFEERDVTPHIEASLPDRIVEDTHFKRDDDFFNNPDVKRILVKYSKIDQLIMYYRFFLGMKVKDIQAYIYVPVSYHKVTSLRKKLKKDMDVLRLMKESNVRF